MQKLTFSKVCYIIGPQKNQLELLVPHPFKLLYLLFPPQASKSCQKSTIITSSPLLHMLETRLNKSSSSMRNLLRTLSGTFLLPKASALQVKLTWNLHWTGTFPLEAPTSNGTFQQNRPEGFPGNLPTVRAEKKQQDHLTIHHHSCSESTRIHGLFLIEKSLYFVNRIHPKW